MVKGRLSYIFIRCARIIGQMRWTYFFIFRPKFYLAIKIVKISPRQQKGPRNFFKTRDGSNNKDEATENRAKCFAKKVFHVFVIIVFLQMFDCLLKAATCSYPESKSKLNVFNSALKSKWEELHQRKELFSLEISKLSYFCQ